VDMLKLIQLGLTFANAEGKLPLVSGELCVWQFNFRCAAPTAPGLACSPVIACERTRGGRRWALAAPGRHGRPVSSSAVDAVVGAYESRLSLRDCWGETGWAGSA